MSQFFFTNTIKNLTITRFDGNIESVEFLRAQR